MKNGVIASLLVVALIVGIAFGTVFFPRTITLTSTQTTTLHTIQTTTLIGPMNTTTQAASTQSSGSIDTIALPCGSPGVYCGGSNITSASLTVNGSYSVLQLTLTELGNMYIGSATVYVNATVIGVPPASEYEPPGNIPLNVTSAQPAVLVLTIPNSTIPIHAGMTYSVMVYCWLGPPGERASSGDQASINIKAN